MVTMPNELLSGNIADATNWYVLYTRHQHEKTVAQLLSNKGFEILLPLYSSVNRWKDRTKLVTLPLFPCYVFLKGGLERRVDIMKTPGVNALISSAGHPAAVPVEEMEAIQRIVASGADVEPHPFMKCGDRVKVNGGPLAGLEGILVQKKDRYRLVLSVEMLGKSASVEVDAFLVGRLGKQSHGGREHRCTPTLIEARL
jgi:transcription antitermination factor NusG